MKLCDNFDLCQNYTENDRVELCASCAASQRKASKQALKQSQKKPLTHIRKVSDKKADKLKEYTKLRDVYLKANSACQANLLGICENTSREIHHCSTSDLDFLNGYTWLAVCRPCHNHIERVLSAAERREKGFLI